ncbi:MAG: heavy metal translocating P-type ATPase [Desulfobacteraceae bacterium]|jgi:Cd2+/Zn2+-exporting ATPase
MASLNTEKFQIKNLDCANCAAKIERELNKINGIQNASVDFANLTLYVTTEDIKQVFTAIRQIDPQIELISQIENAKQINSAPSEYKPSKELMLLYLAGICFVIVLLLENKVMEAPSPFIQLSLVSTAYLLAGWNVIKGALRTIANRTFFDENVLMVIATIGALGIQAYSEAIGVMIFYKVGELLQEKAISRSRHSIRSLLAERPEKAVVKTEEGLMETDPEQVSVGDEIVVKPGEKIPLDGKILQGNSQIDTSPLTGEFKPLNASSGDMVMAGQINKTGMLTVIVTKPFMQSSIAKIMDLTENATARKANTEKFITTFARYYTPAVVLIATAIATIPPLVFDAAFDTWLYRALVILVISCPCALMVSIPLGYFGGIGRASKNGILVKGSNFIDVLADLKTVVFDKTGTLTQGAFTVKQTVNLNGYSKKQILEFAAAAESHSTHPIATSIRNAFAAVGGRIDPNQVTHHTEISGEGVYAEYQGKTILVGNDNLLHKNNIAHGRCEFDTTVAHVAVNGEYVGILMIGDQIKDDAHQAITKLRKEGIDGLFMLTGDNNCSAKAVAQRLTLDHFYANLLPEEKVSRFEEISSQRQNLGKIAFVGDGINDAPVIARADVGIAMGALGSDAAIETADVVFMSDAPSKLPQAVVIAKQTRKIVWQNISLAFSIKIIFITLGAMGLTSMWGAVFADVGTALLAVLNSTRTLKI